MTERNTQMFNPDKITVETFYLLNHLDSIAKNLREVQILLRVVGENFTIDSCINSEGIESSIEHIINDVTLKKIDIISSIIGDFKDGIEKIVIDKYDYDEFSDESTFLMCLHNAGVSNWDGYGLAQDYYSSIKEDDE